MNFKLQTWGGRGKFSETPHGNSKTISLKEEIFDTY